VVRGHSREGSKSTRLGVTEVKSPGRGISRVKKRDKTGGVNDGGNALLRVRNSAGHRGNSRENRGVWDSRDVRSGGMCVSSEVGEVGVDRGV
jgi:hypothetical protein